MVSWDGEFGVVVALRAMSPGQLDALAEAAQAGTRKADDAVDGAFRAWSQPCKSWQQRSSFNANVFLNYLPHAAAVEYPGRVVLVFDMEQEIHVRRNVFFESFQAGL